MKTLRIFLAVFILAELTFSWASAQEYYTQDEQNKKIIKQGLVGAGVGAVASGASGGSAGKGALIGAGTNVIGSALLDTFTASQNPQPQPQVQYAPQAPERASYNSVEAPPRRGCGR